MHGIAFDAEIKGSTAGRIYYSDGSFESRKDLYAYYVQHPEITHRAQTEIIQNEARGIRYEYSMLFNHAQDTLMTINSEIELTADLILTFEVVMRKLAEKEG